MNIREKLIVALAPMIANVEFTDPVKQNLDKLGLGFFTPAEIERGNQTVNIVVQTLFEEFMKKPIVTPKEKDAAD